MLKWTTLTSTLPVQPSATLVTKPRTLCTVVPDLKFMRPPAPPKFALPTAPLLIPQTPERHKLSSISQRAEAMPGLGQAEATSSHP